MYFTPRPHQQMIHDHVTSRKESMVIAGMGLGKTGASFTIAETLILGGEVKGILVVAPLRVTNLTWGNEQKKWDNFSWLKVANMRTAEGQKQWHEQSADIYLINYDQMQQFCAKYLKGKHASLPVDAVIWDEISKAKSPTSKRINTFRAHRSKFKYHIGLTGTPASNSYLALFAQYRLLDGGKRLGIVYNQFRREYFESDYHGYKWTLKHGAKELIQHKIADMTITLRSEDYLDIPDVVVEDVYAPLQKEALKLYKDFQKEYLLDIGEGEIEAVNAAVLAGKLQQLTGGAVYDEDRNWHTIHNAKIEALRKLCKKLRKKGETVLVIYHYKHELERILKALPNAELFTEERLGAWNKKHIPIWVANAASIGHGLNLQDGGNNMVWFTLTYSRELYDQTNARLARTGQQYVTTIYRLLCRNTIDDAIAETLRERGDSQNELLLTLRNLHSLNT